MVTPAREGHFPKRHHELELKEAKKNISYVSIPKTVDDLAAARSILNEEFPITLQSEAFDVAFQDPEIRINRRLNIW